MWVSRKKWDHLVQALESANEQLEANQQQTRLVGIEREGRTLQFTFQRSGQIYQVEACSMISDNMKEWKEQLL